MFKLLQMIFVGLLVAGLSSCSGGNLFKSKNGNGSSFDPVPASEKTDESGTIWDLFSNADDPNTTIAVNKYIWNASLDVLSFLPIEGADPFSGVIVTGWGRAKGSSRSYRATIYVQDAALDARSLRVALVSRAGPANRDTIRAIENAILTRARQLRIADSKL